MSNPGQFKSAVLGLLCLVLTSGMASAAIITSTGNGNWGTTGTWVGGVVPVAGDDVIIAAGHTVTLNVNTAATLSSLTINLGGVLSAIGGNTVNATTITVNGTYINGSTGTITVTTMDVNGGATFIHAIDGGALPIATWAASSILNITGIITNSPPSNLNQLFGDFNWNSSGQTTNVYLESDIDIQGDFNIINTGLPYDPGTRAVRMSPNGLSYTIDVGGDLIVSNIATFKMNNSTGACTMNVGGDFIMNGGNYTISTGPTTVTHSTLNVSGDVNILGGTLLMQEDANAAAIGILNVDGDLTVAAGATITETEVGKGQIFFTGGGTQTYTDGGTVSNIIDFTINSGSALRMATAGTSIDGDGAFVLASGATLGINSASGITSAGASGNIQVTGSRTYNTGANYFYNGSSNQDVGNGLPATVNSLIINNNGAGGNNTVVLGSGIAITGVLNVLRGIFDLAANNVTSIGSLNMTGSTILGSGTLTLSGDVTTNASTRTATINAPISLGGANRNFTVANDLATPDLNINGIISGADMVVKTGTGSLSLSAANTYSGGTNLFTGVLNINSTTALGSGILTISGGAIDNTSGGAITLSNNNTQAWNSDFTFLGTNNLNLGTGSVTPSGNRQITVGGSNLTVGGVIAGGAISITKLGSGTLSLSGNNTFSGGLNFGAGTLNINSANALGAAAGTFTISGGTINNTSGGGIATANYPQAWNGDFAFTGTDDLNLGTGNVSIGSNRQLTVNGGILTVGGTLSAAAFDLTKAGGGTLNFGANPVTLNGLTIGGGTLLSTSGNLTLSGNFNNSGTFTHNSGTVIYNGAASQNIASVSYNNLTLTGAGQKNAVSAVNIATNLNNSAVLDMVTFTLGVSGVTINSGTMRFSGASNGLALSDGTIEYYGSSQTVIAGSYNNLDINQSGGEAILAGNTSVNGTLSLIARNLNLGGFNLTIGPTGDISVAGPSASKMIIDGGGGQLRKEFTATGPFTFPIGDNSGMLEYSPVTVNLTGEGGFAVGAYIATSVIDSKHPNNASGTDFLSRYWEVSTSGITTPVATVTSTYTAADINGTEGTTNAAQLDGAFSQTSNPWGKFAGLAGNTLTAAGVTLTDGQTSTFTGITGTAANPSITIDLGATVEVCEGSNVVLNTTLVGGDNPIVYSWSPVTDLSSPSVANPTFTGNTPGGPTAYMVTVYDGNGIMSSAIINVTVTDGPTADAGSDDETCADQATYTIAGTSSSNGIIAWTSSSSGGVGFSDPTIDDPIYTINATDITNETVSLTKTVSSAGSCVDAVSSMILTIDQTPTASLAGADQIGLTAVCGTSTTLTANTPMVGTGLWTIMTGDGNGAFVDATSPTTNFTGSLEFTYTLTWTISNGVCPVSTTNVNIEFDANPTTSLAGVDQILCGINSFTMASNTPVIGTGLWTLIGGVATITTPGSISTTITGVPSGTSATLRWTITNGVCTDSFDEIIVTNSMPAMVSVPADFAVCEPFSFPLAGTIGGGATAGLWQVISGSGTLSASAISGTTITATYFPHVSDVSTIVILRLITNDPDGPSAPCTTVFADQNITIDESAKVNAGGDQQICEDVSAVLSGNVFGSVSTGTWTIVSGGDGNFDNANNPVTNYNPGANDMLNGAVVTLRLTSANPGTTCGIVFDETVVTVNKLPEVLLTGLSPVYQEDAPPVPLTGFPTTGGLGIFSGPGVVGNQFFPTVANLTPIVNTVVYTFTNTATGCTNFDSFDVIVNPVTTVDFTIDSSTLNAADELEICSDNGLLQLQGIPDLSFGLSGGFSSVNPVMQANITIVAGLFFVDTDNMPSDLYDITYTFTNTLGATSTKTRFIKVFAGPISDFTIGNFCVDSPIVFSDISSIGASPFGGTIDTWAWTFGDGTVSTLQNPTHVYANEGSYDISLTVTSDQGCIASVTKTSITFGAVPIVSFSSSDFCNGETTTFLGSIDWGAQIPSAITDYTWAYGDGVVESTGTLNTTDHDYPGQGVYNTSMTVTTTEGCRASDTQPIGIFPFTTVNIVDEYVESFEVDEGGWIAGALVTSDSSWRHGPPSGNVINSASDGVNAWWTGGNPDPNEFYYNAEKSFVDAPCFDLTNLVRPMISLDTWDDAQEGFDGAVLQYSINGGISWLEVGEIDKGVNWYNKSGILGRPGGSQNGWSTPTAGWVTSRYSLEQIPLANRDQVRLRVAFGSNEDNPIGVSLNGFAFDNVEIRERDRIVLVENFTSLNEQSYDQVRSQMLSFEAQRPTDFIYLNYHIPEPGEDSLFQDNRSQPQTRANVYGISQSINTALDGNTYIGSATGWPIDSVDTRTLIDPQFDISLQVLPTSADSLIVSWRVTAKETINNPIIVHTVVIEEQVNLGDGTIGYNIVKKMLPNSAGSSRDDLISFQPGDEYSSAQIEWLIDVNLYDGDQLAVVVFVQERTDGGLAGEIYQVAYAKVTDTKNSAAITSIDDALAQVAESISIYPNPVESELHFITSNRPGDFFNWRIIDQRGVEIAADYFNFVDGKYSVDTQEIPNGIYYLIISAKDQPLSYEKLIIMHR